MAIDCKLCYKRFSNGKALGAHMRSHYAILPLPPKTPHQRQELTVPLTESTSSVDERESSGYKSLLSGTYGLREIPRKSSHTPDPEFPDVGSVESDSGSTWARFKRARGIDDQKVTKKAFKGSELEKEDDDVALCLIMLSRDAWRKNPDDDPSMKIYRCEKCYKVFKSSQGLGSHKATHLKKIKNPFQEKEFVHECALCPRIFKSAQALGGHKRSHIPSSEFGKKSVDLDLTAAATVVKAVNEEIFA